MEQEDKELLLKDLCARLPYKVIVDYGYNAFDVHNGNYVKHRSKCILKCYLLDVFMSPRQNEKGEYIKPYLRSMSSMTEEETKELLFVRLEAKYGKSCVYITNFIELNEVSFRKEPPYVGSVVIWFSFENKIVHDSKIREYSKCEYLGQINDITLAEIDWLNAHHFDYRGLIEKGLAIEVTKENNPYENNNPKTI